MNSKAYLLRRILYPPGWNILRNHGSRGPAATSAPRVPGRPAESWRQPLGYRHGPSIGPNAHPAGRRTLGSGGTVMELVITDAVFVTMAADAAPAESMLIRDDRIAAIGPAEAVRAAAAPGAEVVRLGGATVIPGLIDAHCHVADVGYLATAA